MANPLEALRKAATIGADTPYALPITEARMPMPPLGRVLSGLKGVLGLGGEVAEQAATKIPPSVKELEELFPRAKGVLGDPIEQGRQAVYKRFWKMK